MRIKELKINNWEVVRQADLEELSDFVVVAGPNGVGKTKIKDAIVHIFRNNGNPPPGSSVILEATNEEELNTWKTREFSLPQKYFWSMFSTSSKRLKTNSRLIQIDSNRTIESVNFQELTFQQIGDPKNEDIAYNYGFDNVKARFKDICHTLHRLKSKEVTSVYNEYNSQLDSNKEDVTIKKIDDPTEIFIILIDEPEVHLHPELTFRLVKVLKSIGKRNQFFLFTHSPDIIGNSLDTGVPFVRPKSKIKTGNQVIKVDNDNLEGFRNIPNIRETIGMVSVGKKLLFVEVKNTSIDRDVFATIAKAAKTDVAIIPSDSCSNINNMSLICETFAKGVFGIELFMVRDRDGLTDEQIQTFTEKSKGKLNVLPYYHIENFFLAPKAIEIVAKRILLEKAPSLQEITDKLIGFVKNQINYTVILYVKNEIYFQAGNFNVNPSIPINNTMTIDELKNSVGIKRDTILARYSNSFSDTLIEEMVLSPVESFL